MDGYIWNAPTGFSFISTPNDSSAEVLFNWNRWGIGIDDIGQVIFSTTLSLTGSNKLGTFSWVSGSGAQLSAFTPRHLPLDTCTAGAQCSQQNPHYAGDLLFYDTTGDTEDIHVASTSGSLTGGPWTTPAPVPKVSSGDSEANPHFDPPNLYFSRHAPDTRGIFTAALIGADPTLDASWQDPAAEVLAEPDDWLVGREGAIVHVGEPSVAHTNDGKTWLYFIYVRNGGGQVHFNVGRVQRAQ